MAPRYRLYRIPKVVVVVSTFKAVMTSIQYYDTFSFLFFKAKKIISVVTSYTQNKAQKIK